MASAADQPDVMADWAGGRRCAVCRARIGVRNSRSCNRCWRLVCNSGPCWVWGLCTPCRSDNHGVTSVEGQEEKDKACETLDINDPTVKQDTLGCARATSVVCTRCKRELDYSSVLICCACKQLYCPSHCVSELCDTCYSPPGLDKERA